MPKDIPDQVVLAGKLLAEDAALLWRILAFEQSKACALADAINPGQWAADPNVMARLRLTRYIQEALLKAGRSDILDRAKTGLV